MSERTSTNNIRAKQLTHSCASLGVDKEQLEAGVLTQLGGCVLLDESGEVMYEFKDKGICHVCRFEDIFEKLKRKTKPILFLVTNRTSSFSFSSS